MRPIDADALHKEISECPESVMYKDWVQSAIANAPTIVPPPNDLLTMEQLLEMDGEPVWFEFDDFFGWSTIKYANSEFLATWRFGFLLWAERGKTWAAYCRKPEGRGGGLGVQRGIREFFTAEEMLN